MTPEQIVKAAIARAKEARQKRGILTDMERIQALPFQDFLPKDGKWPGGVDLVEKWTSRFQRGDTCALPLREAQAVMLEECSWAAAMPDPVGGLFNVGVGKGKTLGAFLIPEVFDAKRPMMLAPPSMRSQLEGDFFEWSKHYKFRLRYEDVVYYSNLSRPEASALLRERQPDLIIADEAHMMRHATAARTKRFIRYFQNHPTTRLVAMSGTLTGSALSDYAHLSEMALRQYSPLPLHEHDINMWGSVLNAEGEPDGKAWQAVSGLDPSAADDRDVERMRFAFRRKFSTSPGVVSTVTSSCDADIVLTGEYPQISDEVKEALATVTDDYMLPNGEEIVDALGHHRALGQISCGFYYVWDWPDGEEDEEWVDARRMWWGSCRQYLKRYAREGCDSPFLVEEHVRSARSPPELHSALLAWDEQKVKDPPPTKTIWIDPTPVLHAVQWAMQRERCFIWYRSLAVGDMLEAFGMPRFGDGNSTPDPELHPRAALSISVFHKGRNFQAWDDQLILEPMGNAATWEQLLGRTHRQGQESEVVRASIFQHTWPYRNSLKKAVKRAKYIQQTQGQPQKLLLARRDFE